MPHSPRRKPCNRVTRRRTWLRVESLENRLVLSTCGPDMPHVEADYSVEITPPSKPLLPTASDSAQSQTPTVAFDTFSEVEPNNTSGTANAITVPTGDILTTPAANWLTVNGAITSGDSDFVQVTLAARSGLFVDIDAKDIELSMLDSIVTVLDASQAVIDDNDEGYDFEGITTPTTSTFSGALSNDASLYVDLPAGTYFVRVTPFSSSTGAYQMRLLADTNYSSTVPTFESLPGAADTLYLDFDGHSATADGWGTYTAVPYDFSGNGAEFSPGERLAFRNTWKAVAEDYSPFNLNVSTATPGTLGNGVGFRMVVTSSSPTIVGQPSGILGVAYLNSYASFGVDYKTAFTWANNFSEFLFSGDGGKSGRIMASAIEMANTTSHEFGHALSLDHYATSSGSAGSASVEVNGIIATPDTGFNREIWEQGTSSSGAQDDDSVISNVTNTFGYRVDDHGNTTGTATVLTGTTIAATGIIENVDANDNDYFRFTASGATTITADIDTYIANLDPVMDLYNSSGGLIATVSPANPIDAIVTATLPTGIYYVSVRSNGDQGSIGQYTLRVSTNASNQPPAIDSPGNATFVENSGPIPIATNALVTDPDSPADFDTGTLTVSIQSGLSIADELVINTRPLENISVNTGTQEVSFSGTVFATYTGGGPGGATLEITLDADASLAAVQSLVRAISFRTVGDDPTTTPRIVRMVLTDGDGGTSAALDKTVNVQAVNDKPLLGLGGTVNYTENGAHILPSSSASLSDIDSENFAGGTFTVTNNSGDPKDEVFIRVSGNVTVVGASVRVSGTEIGTFTGGPGNMLAISLDSDATPAALQEVIRVLRFRNTGNNPVAGNRTLTFLVTEADATASSPRTKIVNVIPVNDAPVLGGAAAAIGYVNAQPPINLLPGATVADIDNTNFAGGTLTVAISSGDHTSNRLFVANASGFTVVGNEIKQGATVIGTITSDGSGTNDLVISLTSNATTAVTRQLLRIIRFRTTTGSTSTTARVVDFTLADGAGGSDTISQTVNVS